MRTYQPTQPCILGMQLAICPRPMRKTETRAGQRGPRLAPHRQADSLGELIVERPKLACLGHTAQDKEVCVLWISDRAVGEEGEE